MPDSILWPLVFVSTLIVLLKASDEFVKNSERIGVRLGIPSFIIGVTVVAFGTSLPELITSIFAVIEDSSEIVVGNVIGSNISNILLIIGIASVVGKTVETKYKIERVDLPLLAASSFLLLMMLQDGSFQLSEAIICLVGMALYLMYTISSGKANKEEDEKLTPTDENMIKVVGFLLIAGAFIFFSAQYNVKAIIEIATLLGVGEEIIALTVVSIGTSLPELVVSLAAIRIGNADMAIGNVLGSNIFNTFAVMGIPGVIGTLIIPPGVVAFSLPIMVLATLLFIFVLRDRTVSKWEGAVLLLFYVFFIVKLVERL